MLQIKNLHSGYGKFEVLKGIDIEVGDNEIVAIIGPNGAGKSTVIKSVFNLAKIKSGEVLFNEIRLVGKKTHELIKNGICYVPQGRVIFGNLKIRENLEVGGRSLENKEELNERMREIFDFFPVLGEKLENLAYSLSGGERQMLAFGMSLMMKPKLLMLDEPSLGLSPILQKELFLKIKELKEKLRIGIVVVEQNAKKAIEISDKVYLLEDGKVVLQGGKEILKKKKIKQVYLGGRY
jgi:branched-chain amino acid transport system ATP-binding protein